MWHCVVMGYDFLSYSFRAFCRRFEMDTVSRVRRYLRTVFILRARFSNNQSNRQWNKTYMQCTECPKKQNYSYLFSRGLITVSPCHSIFFHVESHTISLWRSANCSFSSKAGSDNSENDMVSDNEGSVDVTPISKETYQNFLEDNNDVPKSLNTGNNSEELEKATSKLVTEAAKLDVMINSLNQKKLQKDIEKLVNAGFHISDFHILCKCPGVFLNLSRFNEFVELLYSLGYRQIDIVRMFSNHPPVMLYKAEDFMAVFKSLNQIGFRSKGIVKLTMSCPVVLQKDQNVLQARLSALQELFKTQDVFSLIGKSPHVLIDSMDSILERFAYVSQEMGITQRQMMYSDLFNLSLEHLHTRHMYLVRTGYFKKVINDKQISLNPSLDVIINTSDEAFIKRFGGLTVEEYRVFAALLKRDRMISNRNMDLQDDDDED